MADTLLTSLVERIQSTASYNRGSQVAPGVVLWTDPDGQWESAVRQLRELWPSLLVLGEYNANRKTGPAIWLKCMLAKALPEADWTAEEVSVIYLPSRMVQIIERSVCYCYQTILRLVCSCNDEHHTVLIRLRHPPTTGRMLSFASHSRPTTSSRRV